MEQNIYFERCVDFLARMIEKYGDELLVEENEKEESGEKEDRIEKKTPQGAA